MRKVSLLSLLASFIALPTAYAQPAPAPGPAPAAMARHDGRPVRPASAQPMVPRDQSMKMRSELIDLNNRITQAERARRIPVSAAGGLRREIGSVQHTYWSRMEGGMTRSEYGSTQAQIARIRGQFEGFLAKGDRPRH